MDKNIFKNEVKTTQIQSSRLKLSDLRLSKGKIKRYFN